MARKFSGDTLIIASHNPGKIREIAELLGPFHIAVKSGMEFGFEEPEENGKNFIENAEIKSRYFAEKTGLPSLSDDSGMEVTALNGDPGIYSARWAGPTKDFRIAFDKVEKLLRAKGLEPNGQAARFVCSLSLAWPDGVIETVQGTVSGTLRYPASGRQGFGYDPIFVPDGHAITFAEMKPEEKHKISHRADAFGQMLERCFA